MPPPAWPPMTRLLAIAAVTAGCSSRRTGRRAEDTTQADGFVQLFNGKDLTGWKTHPDDKDCKWEVDGRRDHRPADQAGHLFSERGDYENFVYRIEAKINDKGNSGQYFRAKFEKASRPATRPRSTPRSATRSRPAASTRLQSQTDRGRSKEARSWCSKAPHKPDEWFTQEVTAERQPHRHQGQRQDDGGFRGRHQHVQEGPLRHPAPRPDLQNRSPQGRSEGIEIELSAISYQQYQ